MLPKLQALVYDIFPPTTALLGYAVGLEKLSLVLKWPSVCNRQLKLYQAFLSKNK